MIITVAIWCSCIRPCGGAARPLRTGGGSKHDQQGQRSQELRRIHPSVLNTHACLSSHETLRCAQLAQCPAWADAAGGREPSRVARQERSGRAEVGYGDPRTGVIDALTGGDTPLLPSVLLATGTLRQLPMLVLLGDAAAICRGGFPPLFRRHLHKRMSQCHVSSSPRSISEICRQT